MKAYALTGGIGSGKSQTASFFSKLGAVMISADKITHELLEPNTKAYQSIVKHFGDDILTNDSISLCKSTLKKKIFNDPKEKAWLEALIHPMVRKKIKDTIKQNQEAPLIIVEIPLLKSKEDFPYLDGIIYVDCDKKTQIKRTIKRDNIQSELVENIISSQTFLNNTKLEADYLINNNGSLEDLNNKIKSLYIKLTT